jgi:hypothetical protein
VSASVDLPLHAQRIASYPIPFLAFLPLQTAAAVLATAHEMKNNKERRKIKIFNRAASADAGRSEEEKEEIGKKKSKMKRG